MKRLTLLISAGLLVVNISVLQADTILVPSQQPTIQAGIDAAIDGDTVLVADGTYTGEGNRDIDLGGKGIVVISENGLENCVIDCEGTEEDPHRGFYFHSGEDSTSVLVGFTVTHGYAFKDTSFGPDIHGGAVYCSASSPTIRGNKLTWNTVKRAGGGIYCGQGSAPIIEGNMILHNSAGLYSQGGSGGGISCWESSPRIVNNIISWNSSRVTGGGGGIACYSSSSLIKGNVISYNQSDYGGGGIDVSFCSSKIEGNIIARNVAQGFKSGSYGGNDIGYIAQLSNLNSQRTPPFDYGFGGGISCYDFDGVIEGNQIMENEANEGGGLNFYASGNYTVSGNIIRGNVSRFGAGMCVGCGAWAEETASLRSTVFIIGNWIIENDGGGIFTYHSPKIYGNIIARNTARDGAGIVCQNSSPVIQKSTIVENEAEYAQGVGGIFCTDSSSPLVKNSIIWNNTPKQVSPRIPDTAIRYSDIQGGWVGVGNIDEDPMFVLPDRKDYRLLWGSPCIDTGHPDYFDPDGTRIDMGAYFFDQNDYLTLYITPDTTEVAPGGQLGVTYTAINRWPMPESFWVLSRTILPGGNTGTVVGPHQYTLPADTTVQVDLVHEIPETAPIGIYEYKSWIGIPPGTIHDHDSFKFTVQVNPCIQCHMNMHHSRDLVCLNSDSLSREMQPFLRRRMVESIGEQH